MNYELLAEEVRNLAGGDVDAEIQFSGMTDREIVEYVVTCPCCDERNISDEALDALVTNATSLEDFIQRYNVQQHQLSLTPQEVSIASDIIKNAINSAVATILNLRGVKADNQKEINRVASDVWALAETFTGDEFYE